MEFCRSSQVLDSTHSHTSYIYASYQHQANYSTAEYIHMLVN